MNKKATQHCKLKFVHYNDIIDSMLTFGLQN